MRVNTGIMMSIWVVEEWICFFEVGLVYRGVLDFDLMASFFDSNVLMFEKYIFNSTNGGIASSNHLENHHFDVQSTQEVSKSRLHILFYLNKSSTSDIIL